MSFGSLSYLLPPGLGPGLRAMHETRSGPNAWHNTPVEIVHLVPPNRTKAMLMRGALERVQTMRGEQYQPFDRFLEAARPRASEDSYALGPLPNGWSYGTPYATLVNSVYMTNCEGAFDAVLLSTMGGDGGDEPIDEGEPTAPRKRRRGSVSYLAMQQLLLGVVTPFPVATSGYLFRIKFRPPERATHRFNPADLSVQSVGIASDLAGALTCDLTTQLIAAALHLPRFVPVRNACYNRVFTIYLPFGINIPAFEAANPQLIAARHHMQCTVATPPLGELAPCVQLLIFPSGVIICVGAKQTPEMEISMSYFLPLLFAARMEMRGVKRERGGGGDAGRKQKKRARTITTHGEGKDEVKRETA